MIAASLLAGCFGFGSGDAGWEATWHEPGLYATVNSSAPPSGWTTFTESRLVTPPQRLGAFVPSNLDWEGITLHAVAWTADMGAAPQGAVQDYPRFDFDGISIDGWIPTDRSVDFAREGFIQFAQHLGQERSTAASWVDGFVASGRDISRDGVEYRHYTQRWNLPHDGLAQRYEAEGFTAAYASPGVVGGHVVLAKGQWRYEFAVDVQGWEQWSDSPENDDPHAPEPPPSPAEAWMIEVDSADFVHAGHWRLDGDVSRDTPGAMAEVSAAIGDVSGPLSFSGFEMEMLDDSYLRTGPYWGR